MSEKAILMLVGIAVSVLGGCGKRDDATYQGKTVQEWIILSKDADHDTRWTAFDALSQLKGQSPNAKARLSEAFSSAETLPQKLKLGIYIWPDRADETFAVARTILHGQADKDGQVFSIGDVRSLMELDAKRKRQLATDLDYALKKTNQAWTDDIREAIAEANR